MSTVYGVLQILHVIKSDEGVETGALCACTRCGNNLVVSPLSKVYASKSRRCSACPKRTKQEQQHEDYLRKKARHPQKTAQEQALYRARHPDRVKETKQRQYAKWKERMLSDPEFKEKDVEQAKRYYEKADRKRMRITQLCARARQRGYVCDLSVDDVDWVEVCPVFGKPIAFQRESPGPWSVSVDRVDSTSGYVKGNVQVMSRKANTMKSDATPEELLQFADWVYKTYSKGGVCGI